tara:strand:+ start:3354 stop:4610 length:1257 start_codon:yes stop_codon:yes gene_type:complete
MDKATTSGGKTVGSPIFSMRDGFRSLKNNLKSMSKSILGVQEELQKRNKLNEKHLENIKNDAVKRRDLQEKESEERRLEKPNLVGDTFANIGKTIKKTGGNLLSRALTVMGLFAGAWLLQNAGNIMEKIQGGMDFITDVWKKIGNFIEGSMDFVKGLGKLILAAGENILSFDFADSSGKIKDAFSDLELAWEKLNGDITGAEKVLENPDEEFKKEDGGVSDSDVDASEENNNESNNENNNENGNQSSSNSEKVDPLVVLDDNRDLIPLGLYDLVKNQIEKNPAEYDTKEEINAALEKFGIDPSEVKYRKNYSSGDRDNTVENKQLSMADKIHQQVDAAGQKLKNEDLRIESRNNTEQKIAMITPELQAQEITVIDNRPKEVTTNGSSDIEGGNIIISGNSDELNSIENQLMLQDLTYT